MVKNTGIMICFVVPSFYRSGNLHTLSHLCSIHMNEDLQYWGINANLMDACCLLTHYPELKYSQTEYIREQKTREKAARTALEENFGNALPTGSKNTKCAKLQIRAKKKYLYLNAGTGYP